MPVKLRVINEADEESSPSEYLFDRDRITIGRGGENHLTLDDPKRIVSTEHAEIRREGDTYQLVDRGSKNFTYLGGTRLEAGTPHPLQDGDVFSVGDFKIEFDAVKTSEPTASPSEAAGQTVFAADFTNPFTDPAERLVEALSDIATAYDEHPPQRREAALEDAFQATDGAQIDVRNATHLIRELLGASSEETSSEETSRSDSDTAEHGDGSPVDPPDEPEQTEGASGKTVQAKDEAVDEVIDALLEALSRIVDIPWQFRHEFIGQTIMQSAETEFIYDGDAETMKEHLLDPSLSQDERQQRLDLVRDAAESLAVHQVAMLNGYKASVMNGAEELVDQMDPDAHQAEVEEESPIYEYVPVLASPIVLERLRTKWDELQSGDWSAAEQRIFRPAFIKAYLARMTAQPSDEN